MAKTDDQRDGAAIHLDHAEEMHHMDNLVHGKEKWWNWRVMMNRKMLIS